MAVSCTFSLNNKSSSVLHCEGFGDLPAFSGAAGAVDNPAKVGIPMVGPLPRGLYYIVGRQSGGRFGWLYELVHRYILQSDQSDWFALYRADGQIDDYTFIEGIKRGNFRLHPAGIRGISEGCITVVDRTGYARLRTKILGGQMMSIPGAGMLAYGTVEVR
ncbi:DUF2778 domain-containing protein [Acetobacter sacchari]|uniref:DUF2778 domain-containing protein n=1 Tax=Acetobacter sacchari TaxID=2661687 RepID=A0ABS3LZT9_9PROT|nr:DUF2778 domain-containing protein [Acetobacter sacchari]MBO1361424.1 DUF2778 domain-containing protein [Acetobacter sacchari]